MGNSIPRASLRLLLLSPLMGAATGDALGTTLEFSSPGPLPWDGSAKHRHVTITGGGPFSVAVGQITDDTMMACAIAGSLTARGRFDAADIGERYNRWRGVTFDIGGTTSGGIGDIRRAVESGRHPLRAVRPSTGARANGALMRATPHAVFRFRDRRDVVRRAVWDAMLTHKSPHCIVANAAYCAAIASALSARAGGETLVALILAAAVKGAKWGAKVAVEMLRDSDEFGDPGTEVGAAVAEAYADTLLDIRYGKADDPMLYGEAGDRVSITGGSSGYVRTAHRLAWWEAFHAASFADGLIDAVNRGGDADTNGAIVGGLLGAIFGVGGRKGIPSEWVELVRDAKTRQGGLLDTEFHPKVFDTFIDTLLPAPRARRSTRR